MRRPAQSPGDFCFYPETTEQRLSSFMDVKRALSRYERENKIAKRLNWKQQNAQDIANKKKIAF